MHAREIIRVFCVDGPCRGLHYVQTATGRILDEDPDDLGLWYIYRVSDHEITHADPFQLRQTSRQPGRAARRLTTAADLGCMNRVQDRTVPER